ncbi:MAG: GspE/PulE family protein, partial [Pseudomonadota bacterium]
ACGLLTDGQLEDIRRDSRRTRLSLVEGAARFARVPSHALWRAAAERRGMVYLNPRDLAPNEADMERLPNGFALRRQCLPIRRDDELLIATANPDDDAAMEQVSRAMGVTGRTALAHPEALSGAIERALGALGEEVMGREDAITLVDEIMSDALYSGASDVHFLPGRGLTSVRFRVDGLLQDWRRDLRASERGAVTNRLKVLADMDIGESRAPQDGAFQHDAEELGFGVVEVRASALPVKWGERITLRLLGSTQSDFDLGDLGLSAPAISSLRDAIHRPHGLILVTGPTGSGKSTTLYSALKEIDRKSLNVMTVEDPIEQVIADASQVQVNVKIDFAAALRTMLRQDPDVILIGEVRDGETAEIALQAAQTGHLVFSTLHTNNAIGAVTRLADLGVGRYHIAASLEGVIAQRLVRRLCDRCKKPVRADEAEAKLLGVETAVLHHAQGCVHCMGAGYSGRIGVFETLWVTDAARALIAAGAPEAEILAECRSEMLAEDLRAKVLNGIASLDDARFLGLREAF